GASGGLRRPIPRPLSPRRPPSPQGQSKALSVAAAPPDRRRRAKRATPVRARSSDPIPRPKRKEKSTQLRIQGGRFRGCDAPSQLGEELQRSKPISDLCRCEGFRSKSRLGERRLKIALRGPPKGERPAAQPSVHHPSSALESQSAKRKLDRQGGHRRVHRAQALHRAGKGCGTNSNLQLERK